MAAPAIDPVGRWAVEERDGTIFVRERAEATAKPKRTGGPRRVVIAGGGAAGFAAAEMLRREGFDGGVTMVSADIAAPYDRPNCSKDFLAGTAPAEWMPLRDDAWYKDNGIDLKLSAEIASLDVGAKAVRLLSGADLPYDALVLSLGAEPRRLPLPGFTRADVHTLRSLADAEAIVRAAEGAKRVAVAGASFIALEVAAALRHRGIEVHVAAPEPIPLARILGDELGGWVRGLHEENGVVFHLGRKILGWDGARLGLDEGAIDADMVVAGTGVAPRTALAEAAGIRVENGVVVDRSLRASAPGVYAAGDIARFPDARTGAPVRIEHWVHAERQGQHVARAILGDDAPFTDTPFFWSVHYGATINYVGHAEAFDSVEVDGALSGQDAVVRFKQGGKVMAVATVGRDLDSLKAGAAFEREAG